MAREMKDSGIEWIGMIPKEWNTQKIKHWADISIENSFIDGDWIESPYISDNGIRYLTTGNIGDGKFKRQGNGYITIDTFISLNCKYAYPKDLIISRLNAPFGRSCILPNDFAEYVLAVDNVILRTKESTSFFCYTTQCDGYQKAVEDEAKGTTMKRISRTNLGNIFIPHPPLSEQQRIANYLDEKCSNIDELISLEESMIEELKTYKQSVITEAVTKGLNPDAPMKDSGVEWIGEIPEHWEIRKFKNICLPIKYAIKTGPFGSQLKGQDLQPKGDVRVYNQKNVIYNQFDKVQNYITNKKAIELESFYTQPFDLLITSRGTIGKCAILPKDAPMGILHPCLIAMRIDNNICDINFVHIFIEGSSCFSTNVFFSSNATTIEVIYTETLKNINIPIPPKGEQQQIITYLNKKCSEIDEMISLRQEKIDTLKEYKKSLIYEAVTGKIDLTA